MNFDPNNLNYEENFGSESPLSLGFNLSLFEETNNELLCQTQLPILEPSSPNLTSWCEEEEHFGTKQFSSQKLFTPFPPNDNWGDIETLDRDNNQIVTFFGQDRVFDFSQELDPSNNNSNFEKKGIPQKEKMQNVENKVKNFVDINNLHTGLQVQGNDKHKHTQILLFSENGIIANTNTNTNINTNININTNTKNNVNTNNNNFYYNAMNENKASKNFNHNENTSTLTLNLKEKQILGDSILTNIKDINSKNNTTSPFFNKNNTDKKKNVIKKEKMNKKEKEKEKKKEKAKGNENEKKKKTKSTNKRILFNSRKREWKHTKEPEKNQKIFFTNTYIKSKVHSKKNKKKNKKKNLLKLFEKNLYPPFNTPHKNETQELNKEKRPSIMAKDIDWKRKTYKIKRENKKVIIYKKKKKSRSQRLYTSNTGKNILETWFQKYYNDKDGPYPTKRQRMILSKKAGIPQLQVQRWFGQRRRVEKFIWEKKNTPKPYWIELMIENNNNNNNNNKNDKKNKNNNNNDNIDQGNDNNSNKKE
ncbi:hypothetical protein M0813_16926 [Anaeramoeba flamelloides]|uniref:Homeobox domain-containing protein n=1 Tax=Anaeramoeba flamelloides TaxID=1746091 RepID=A0ABQ8YY73_9EUKA|nr:hypothetical protein M0813_16926 [Anaeramoeba flamelloides]